MSPAAIPVPAVPVPLPAQYELFRWVLLRWAVYTTIAFICLAIGVETAYRLMYRKSILYSLLREVRRTCGDGTNHSTRGVTDVVLIGLRGSGKKSLLYWLMQTAPNASANAKSTAAGAAAGKTAMNKTVIKTPEFVATQLTVGGTRLTCFGVGGGGGDDTASSRASTAAAATTTATAAVDSGSIEAADAQRAAIESEAAAWYRDGMQPYLARAKAVIAIVDSRDAVRLQAVDTILQTIFDVERTRRPNKHSISAYAPLLVLSNSFGGSESGGSLPNSIISEALGLDMYRGRMSHVASIDASVNRGVYAAFDWLAGALAQTQESLNGSLKRD